MGCSDCYTREIKTMIHPILKETLEKRILPHVLQIGSVDVPYEGQLSRLRNDGTEEVLAEGRAKFDFDERNLTFVFYLDGMTSPYSLLGSVYDDSQDFIVLDGVDSKIPVLTTATGTKNIYSSPRNYLDVESVTGRVHGAVGAFDTPLKSVTAFMSGLGEWFGPSGLSTEQTGKTLKTDRGYETPVLQIEPSVFINIDGYEVAITPHGKGDNANHQIWIKREDGTALWFNKVERIVHALRCFFSLQAGRFVETHLVYGTSDVNVNDVLCAKIFSLGSRKPVLSSTLTNVDEWPDMFVEFWGMWGRDQKGQKPKIVDVIDHHVRCSMATHEDITGAMTHAYAALEAISKLLGFKGGTSKWIYNVEKSVKHSRIGQDDGCEVDYDRLSIVLSRIKKEYRDIGAHGLSVQMHNFNYYWGALQYAHQLACYLILAQLGYRKTHLMPYMQLVPFKHTNKDGGDCSKELC